MQILLAFVSILAYSWGQLIFPDQLEIMKASTVSPNFFTTINRQVRPRTPSNAQVPAYSLQYPIGYGAQNAILPPSIPPPPLRGMQPKISVTTSTKNPLQGWSDHVNNIIVRGILKFALDIEKEIYRTQSTSMISQRDNIVFSPISLTVTLAIVLAGSAGRTFKEVSRVLGLEAGVDISKNSEVVHQMFGILLNNLHREIQGSPGPRLDFATAAFVQDGYPIRSEFKALSNNVYKNEVTNVDYLRNGKVTQEIINTWVKQKTMGKITGILDSVPDPATTIILLSALYFNGEWDQPFLDSATRRRPFYIEPEESIEVDMMFNGGMFPFYEDKQLGVKILGLPYKGLETTMYVLLPTATGAKALRSFQNQLTDAQIENLINNMKNESCIFSLPRMKLSNSFNLASTLGKLGLTSLFDAATSDLSLISQGNSGAVPIPSPTEVHNRTTPDFSSRFNNDNNEGHIVRRNYFTYEDKIKGLTVQQWSTGFSISKSRGRRDSRGKDARQPVRSEESKNSYKVDGPEPSSDNAKVVNLERNKYRFQEERPRTRSRRQGRPIDENFLEFIEQQNFPSYGLDNLRNTANLVNPHLYASQVLHKVEIDVTETGTEAAAVTGAILERDGNQKRLIANRPFIFFIRHDPTKLVLFWATLNAPTPNYPVGT